MNSQFVAFDRHKIRQLTHAVMMQKAGQQHVGLRQIELLPLSVVWWSNAEPSTPSIIQQRSKQAG
jgi:hypothetical protein